MMQDLAMHLLELLKNATEHNATKIILEIIHDTILNRIFFKVIDDGDGMSQDLLKDITNPFSTTRKTRKIGMGLAFLRSLVDQTEGHLRIESELNVGTNIIFDVRRDHIDLPPLGDIGELILITYNANHDIVIDFKYSIDDKCFAYNQELIEEEVGELDFTNLDILLWVKEYINEGIRSL